MPNKLMRIWDIEPKYLCRKHLLGEHRELHAIWIIITKNKKGYRHHPETKRWVGRLKALERRHEALVKEMARRGYRHKSFLDKKLATGISVQKTKLESIKSQKNKLRQKPCGCFVKK